MGRPRVLIPYSAIVLAGGFSQRLRADKALTDLEGVPLLQHVLDAVIDADSITVVGPQRATTSPVTWCEEEPSGGGPVAAFAAGLRSATAEMVVLLGCDLPFIGPAVPSLLRQCEDVAVLTDATGRRNYLASAWRRQAVTAQLDTLGSPNDLPMRTLLSGLHVVEVPDPDNWGFGCDTPEALAIARKRARND